MHYRTLLTRTALAAVVVAVTLYSCTSAAPDTPATSSPAATAAPTPTQAPTGTPLPTARPSVTPAPSGPALTENFTSEVHGISISYPSGWSIQRAAGPWQGGPFFFRDPAGDFLYDTALTDHLFLALASREVSDSSTETWAADLLAVEGCGPGDPVEVDGAHGLIGVECPMAVVTKDGRGYFIWLYVSGDDPELTAGYDRGFFENVLATVELDPENAVELSPSPAAFADLRNADFRVPFTYALPHGPTFDYGTRNETYWEVRIPAAFEAGHPAGVILQAIGGGRTDPCDPQSDATPISIRRYAVIEYLQTIKDLDVSAGVDLSVGEDPYSPPVQAVASRAERPRCEQIWPWMETTEPFVALPAPGRVRVVAVMHDDEHLVFTIFGEAENAGWSKMANELIDSFRFEAH